MSTAAAEGLSDYQRRRAENIQRNNARLRQLGLISKQEEKESNDVAWNRSRVVLVEEKGREDGSGDDEDEDDEYRESPRRKKQRSNSPQQPSRTSRRLQGLQPDGSKLEPSLEDESDPNDRIRDRQYWVEECRRVRQQRALEFAESGKKTKNPTATYEHCLMRVRTMNDKGLKNRVKAIERAAGKDCILKMAIFKSCLQDEGLWELADLASQSLERLKAMQPLPEKDE